LITSREATAIQAEFLEQQHVGCGQRAHASASRGEPEQVSGEAAPRPWIAVSTAAILGHFKPIQKI
jgi:hypothetical protein